MTEGEQNLGGEAQKLRTETYEQQEKLVGGEINQLALAISLDLLQEDQLPSDLKSGLYEKLSHNLALLSSSDQKILEQGWGFLPQMNVPSLVFGDYVPLYGQMTPSEQAGVDRFQKVLTNEKTKKALTPLLDASFTAGTRAVQAGFGERASASLQNKRSTYMPLSPLPPPSPGSREQGQITFSGFVVEPYTNIPDLENNGRVPHGYGGTLGIQGQKNAFRYGANITALGTGQQTDPTHYYKSNAGFATGTIGLGTHAGNRIALNVDVGAGGGFSAVDGRFGNEKLDETNRFPVVSGNISLDFQLFQRFMREKFKLSLGSGFIAPIGPKADMFEGVKGNGPGGRGLLGIGSDVLLTPLVVSFKFTLGVNGRRGSRYFSR